MNQNISPAPASSSNYPSQNKNMLTIDRAIIQKVPAKFASHYKIIPLNLENNILTIAMADPLDLRTLDDLRLLLGLEVKGVPVSESEIQKAIYKYYGVGAETLERMLSQSSQEELKIGKRVRFYFLKFFS